MGNIILIGFMGSGKTTVGREVAKLKKYKLIDTDEYIENKEDRTIREIFAEDGEAYFRQIEQQTVIELKRLCMDGYVIASGGGLPMNRDNRINLHQIGTIVYLRAKIQTLEKRLTGDTKRPLLSGQKLHEKIQKLLSDRSETYERLADVIIDTDYKNIKQIVKEVISKGL